MSKYLGREAILAAQDIATEEVDVPEWGGAVRVRGMSGRERDAFEASVVQQPTGNRKQRRGAQPSVSLDNIRAKLCAWCIVDDAGERLFADADVAALGAKNASALNRVYEVATRLSGITEDDVDDLAEGMVEHPFVGTSSPSPTS